MVPRQQRSTGSSFAPFLEGLQRRRKVVAVLKESGPAAMADLLSKSEMSFSEFALTIEAMAKDGLVSVSGLPGSEIVTLTPNGPQLASTAR